MRLRKYIKVYIPYYTCEVILEPINKLGIKYEFYHIDERLEPQFDFSNLQEGESMLYTNYFGLKDEYINTLPPKNNIIIDNCQSFFSKPLPWFDTFYSPRKFFGVPDGGYLYTYDNSRLNTKLEQSFSYNRCSHLLKRIDLSAEEGYAEFKRNDKKLSNDHIKMMSNLTKRILSSIDYDYVKEKRNKNFKLFHNQFKDINLLNLDSIVTSNISPMVYPLLLNKPKLREKLISEKIYIPQYWNNVLIWTSKDDFENFLTNHLIALPIDQRIKQNDLTRILNSINKY